MDGGSPNEKGKGAGGSSNKKGKRRAPTPQKSRKKSKGSRSNKGECVVIDPDYLPNLNGRNGGQGPEVKAHVSSSHRHPAFVLTHYTFKGGSGKSTTTTNLAWQFAANRCRVCIVDLDPQTNITGLLADDIQDVEPEEDGEEEDRPSTATASPAAATGQVQDGPPEIRSIPLNTEAECNFDMEQISSSHRGCLGPDIAKVLQPIMEGDKGAFLAEGVSLYRISDPIKSSTSPHSIGERLFILPGSPKLIQYAETLSEVSKEPTTAIVRNGAFRRLFDYLAEYGAFDVIIVDVGPSSGSLNQAAVMATSAFAVPADPDWYSLQSVHTMFNDVLPKWLEWRREWSSLEQALGKKWKDSSNEERARFQKELGPFVLKKAPVLLPVLVNKIKISKHGATKAMSSFVADFVMLMKTVVSANAGGTDEMTKQAFPKASVREELQDLVLQPDGKGRMVIPFLKKLGAAESQSYKYGIPVCALKEGHLNMGMFGWETQGNVLREGTVPGDVQHAISVFDSLVQFMLYVKRNVWEA